MQFASDNREGGMVAVTGVDEETINRLCHEAKKNITGKISPDSNLADAPFPFLEIGNYLGPKSFALSGDISACNSLLATTKSYPGVKSSSLLSVSGAFHTPLMSPAIQRLSEELNEVTFNPQNMTCPLYTNVTGDSCYNSHSRIEDIKSCLLDQLVKPVKWSKTLDIILSNSSFQQAIEIGPGTACNATVKMINRRAKVRNYRL